MSHSEPHEGVLPELPPAIQYLKSLHARMLAPPLQAYLQSLKAEKILSEECLIEGICAFTQIANLSPAEREGVYGSQFFGLHYNSDLKALWNAYSPHKTNLQQVSWLCPPSWECHIED